MLARSDGLAHKEPARAATAADCTGDRPVLGRGGRRVAVTRGRGDLPVTHQREHGSRRRFHASRFVARALSPSDFSYAHVLTGWGPRPVRIARRNGLDLGLDHSHRHT